MTAHSEELKSGTLESLLRMKVKSEGKDGPVDISPQFRVAVQGEVLGGVHFIIHANGHDSETLDLVVFGNVLKDLGECKNE